jgi:hypothetical protein
MASYITSLVSTECTRVHTCSRGKQNGVHQYSLGLLVQFAVGFNPFSIGKAYVRSDLGTFAHFGAS